MDSLDYYDVYILRSSEALQIEHARLQDRLAEIHNTSGLHAERAELRERITVVAVILAERTLF